MRYFSAVFALKYLMQSLILFGFPGQLQSLCIVFLRYFLANNSVSFSG